MSEVGTGVLPRRQDKRSRTAKACQHEDRERPALKDVTVPRPPVRTTTVEASGRTYGVVTGQGSRPDEALENLRDQAQHHAKYLADKHPEEWKSLQSVDLKDPFWFFEVIDLRMVAVPASASWLAYGTLVARTDTPMSIWSTETAENVGLPEGYPWAETWSPYGSRGKAAD